MKKEWTHKIKRDTLKKLYPFIFFPMQKNTVKNRAKTITRKDLHNLRVTIGEDMSRSLKPYTTKQDLEALAKSTYENMVTKEKFSYEITNLKRDIADIKEDIVVMKESMVTKEYVNAIITKEDEIIGMLRKRESEEAAVTFQLHEHEERIVKLEDKVL